jgi:uncharacterized protein YecE (DUF72 family)
LKMPPSFRYTLENLEIVRKFLTNTRVDNNKTVPEFRDSSWWEPYLHSRGNILTAKY